MIATDISREMIGAASRRAAAAGLDNITFLEMSGEQLQCGIESFDSVTSAYGLIIFADLAGKSRIASRSETASARFRAAIADAARRYVVNSRLRLLATSLCASGRQQK